MYALNAVGLFYSSNIIFALQSLISVLDYKKYVLNWVQINICVQHCQKQFIISLKFV